MDRLPPHSIEAEKAVLGCILISPQTCLPECQEIGVTADIFYFAPHQHIYNILCALAEAQPAGIDIITISERLKSLQLLDKVGGMTYLSSLIDAVPGTPSLGYYLKIVKEKAVLRQVVRVCADTTLRVYTEAGEPERLLDQVESDILAIRAKGEAEEQSSLTLVRKTIDKIERCIDRKGQLDGLSYGFTDLDRLTWGMRGGELIVVAARPSCGKTSLCMNIAEHVAVEQGQPVGVFSLETGAETLMFRMQCSRARVDSMRVRRGIVYDDEMARLTFAGAALANAPLHIRDRSGLTIHELRAAAQRMHRRHGIRLFVIDYLQLMSSPMRRNESREREVAQVSNGLKTLAKELNVPVIVISSMNREIEKDHRRPRLADLRESGALEFDADVVLFLYRPMNEDGKPPDDLEHVVKVMVAKQKEGPTGEVDLWFRKLYTRFENLERK